MIWELSLIVALAGIVVIVAHRFPDTVTAPPRSPKTQSKWQFNPKNLPVVGKRILLLIGATAIWLKQLPAKISRLRARSHIRLAADAKSEPAARKGQVAESLDELFTRGDKLILRKRYLDAELIFRQLAKQDPQNARVHSRLGVIHLENRNYLKARDAFLRAINIDPAVAARHFNLGLCYMGMGYAQKARAAFKQALSLDPKSKYQAILKELEKNASTLVR